MGRGVGRGAILALLLRQGESPKGKGVEATVTFSVLPTPTRSYAGPHPYPSQEGMGYATRVVYPRQQLLP